MGDINVYSGPMKCGKTQQILNEYKRQLIAGKKVKMFKPSIDTREGSNVVASRNGIDIPATIINKISDLEKYDAEVYCIDEFQFLKGNVKTIGKMADLLCIADNINMMTAICDNCKNENAIFTYFKGGKDCDIVIGDKEYLSLCRHCYELLSKQDLLDGKASLA